MVSEDNWQVGDLPPFEIYPPQKGMRIFRGFTYRALHSELISPYPLKPVPYNADDYKVAFFVLGLYDSCTLEQIYSSGTLFMWSPRQFKHEHDCATTREYIERLASKFTAEWCNVSSEIGHPLVLSCK